MEKLFDSYFLFFDMKTRHKYVFFLAHLELCWYLLNRFIMKQC